jgi:phosphoglycolate phosphatase
MSKKAVVFPGIGYHKDKPLLYYSIRIAKEYGYSIECVDFSSISWEKKDLNDPVRMKEIFGQAMELAGSQLSCTKDDDVLFISKSIGTVVAACFAKEKGIEAKQIYFSPLVHFGMYASHEGIAFYGDADPLADAGEIEKICNEKGISACRISGGNHSLETGDIDTDLKNLSMIMERVKEYTDDLLG